VQPDIYAKGGDYTIDTINQDERRLIESHGGKVVVLGGVPGKSTTAILDKIGKL
jgi:D-beta-D-heptose 7-phosphate kinase/D-beta-D-heptose 1-phosphate adenosyltransferase